MSDFYLETPGYQNLLFYRRYNLYIVTTIFALDILETFPSEVVHIWKKKIGLFKLLYVITRYIPFLIHVAWIALTNLIAFPGTTAYTRQLMLAYCTPWFVVLAYTEYLFMIRAVALNGNPRWLYYTLMALYIGEIITSFVFYILSDIPSLSLAKDHVNQPIILGLLREFQDELEDGLMSVQSLFLVLAFGIPELFFQSVLVLVIIGTMVRYRKTWSLQGVCTSSLAAIIMRDNIWGYFLNLFGLLVVILGSGYDVWARPSGLEQPSLQWSYLTFSLTSSHLLLNLRSAAEGPSLSKMLRSSVIFNNKPEDNPPRGWRS